MGWIVGNGLGVPFRSGGLPPETIDNGIFTEDEAFYLTTEDGEFYIQQEDE